MSPLYVPVTVAVPVVTPAKETVHLPADKVQLAPTVPTAVLDEVKLTLPPGVFAGVVVSVTVAVHVESAAGTIVLGLQATLVAVLSLAATTLKVTTAFRVTVKPEKEPVTVIVNVPPADALAVNRSV